MEQSGQRVAIVTGGSRGIGSGIATALANAKHDVVVNYARSASAAEEVKREIEAAGSRAHLVQADISLEADRRKLVDETIRAFGRIDLLVNNAGVAPDVRADILEAGEASFDRLIGINLKGPYFLTQLVARRMIEQIEAQRQGDTQARRHEGTEARREGEGSEASRAQSSLSPDASSPTPCLRASMPSCLPPSASVPPCLPKIVTISSISAYTASVNRGDYCIAKAGLSMLTKLYAARLAEYGINVYEIQPGIIETDMTGPVKAKYDKLIFEQDLLPLRRWGKPRDIAAVVVAIASDLLPYSTGEVINVDGGFHLRRL